MKWSEFVRKFKGRGVIIFTPMDIQRVFGGMQSARNLLLHRWSASGKIVRLRRGLYTFADNQPPDLLIANKLYEPSYISLEYALSYHKVIPETVYTITSVTTRVTRTFLLQGKSFSYHQIKKPAFVGYRPTKYRGSTIFIAEPEKAFVDLNYLRFLRGQKPLSRFAKGAISKQKVIFFTKLFHQPKLTAIVIRTLR